MALNMSLCLYAARRLVLNRYRFCLSDMAIRRSIFTQSFLLRARFFSTEPVATSLPQHEGKVKKFQADTSRLLNIVAKSLYSDREIFVRELISNASDAVERLRFLQTSGNARGVEGPLEIHITTDEHKRMFTISDNGVGMTADEMEKNLGTIAKSGSGEYVARMKQNNVSGDDWTNIIGQFGVGFYAAFMVAGEVEVQSKSQVDENDRKGHKWISDGTEGIYTIYESEKVSPGTKVILQLKEDSAEFSRESVIKSIIQKYSNFIGVPVFLNGKLINTVEPLWAKDPSKVTEDEYVAFYQFITGNSYDSPRYQITFKTDLPINLRALLFVPTMKPSIFEGAKAEGSSLSLYCRKILITGKAESLLPKWLRFVRGVVDSEDIPLNLSRELLQDHGLIRKVNRILTSRVLRFLEDESKRDAKKFLNFFTDFGLYLKEGIVTEPDQSTREEIARLLRFESSALPAGQRTSFDEYASRMRAGERNIYFLSAPNRELAEVSPYLEAIKKKSSEPEVLFLYEPYDELVLINMGQYDRKNFCSIEKVLAEDISDSEAVEEIEGDCLSQDEVNALTKWAEETLESKVKKVKVTQRLSQHPCCVQIREAGAMRHLLHTALAGRPALEKLRVMEPVLELNLRHPLVRYLARLVTSASDHAENDVLATALTEYLLDVGLAHAGLLEEAREMASRSSQLLTILSERTIKNQA
ncbi:Heat shock protein 75 kDa mitochondrial [Taenia crassiceps]|uniref:Heat shock protein 75 kDa mitochondrial n=1 Tax=Taenia crassiceps TaxID=6207 RepID=A0ABR4QSP2_9CEST